MFSARGHVGMRDEAARGHAGMGTRGQGGYKLEAPRPRGSVDQRDPLVDPLISWPVGQGGKRQDTRA